MLRAALIGFPGTGKTTLFHLMTNPTVGTKSGGARGDASIGVSRVPDDRLDRLTAMFQPRKSVPATVEFADLAGVDRGGAKALVDVAPYRNADALVHVVRTFRDEAIPLPSGSIDAARDAQAMEDELMLADLGLVERRLERIDRDLKKGAAGADDLRRERDVLARCHAALEQATPLRAIALEPEDAKRLRGFQLLSAKPLLVAINLDESDVTRADRAVDLAGLRGFLGRAATRAVPVCAKIELEIAQLSPEDASTFRRDLGLRDSGLDRVIRATYDLLGYISFFTVGDDECRAWSIPRGTIAHVAAGEIHTDIARGFVRAEVVRYEDLVARGSLAACRDHGQMRLEGKEYVVEDGDVINVRFAT